MTKLLYAPEHCVDGVELVRLDPDPKDYFGLPIAFFVAYGDDLAKERPGTFVCNKSTNVVRSRPIRFTQANTAIERFVKIGSEGDLLDFTEEFGFLAHAQVINDGRVGHSVFRTMQCQAMMKLFLQNAKEGLRDEMQKFASDMLSDPSMRLTPVFEHGRAGQAEVAMRAYCLEAVMIMEGISAVSSGVNIKTCKRCGTFFLTGPATGRTDKAVYCSDSCRVSDARARKQMECVAEASPDVVPFLPKHGKRKLKG